MRTHGNRSEFDLQQWQPCLRSNFSSLLVQRPPTQEMSEKLTNVICRVVVETLGCG